MKRFRDKVFSVALQMEDRNQVLLVAMSDPRDFLVSEDIHIRTGLEAHSTEALRRILKKTA